MGQTDYVVRLIGKDNISPMINDVKKSLESVGTAGTKLDDIKSRFQKITESSAPLGRRIKDIRGEMEKLAQSSDINTKEGQEMWRKLSEAAKEYDKTLQRVRQDTRFTDIGVSDKFDIKSLTSGVAEKVGLGGVSSQIGSALANPYVLAAGAIAGAGKALYDYNVELDRSLQKTQQFTGLSGDALMSLRNGIKSVADTFGKDYDTVLASVDNLMNQFGIQGEEALNIIRDGFASGADEGGRMLEMLSQYGPAFNDAGISASELMAIIGNTRNGIFSEDGMKAIQMAAKRIREMGKSTADSLDAIGISSKQMQQALTEGTMTTMEAIQKVSDRLKDLPPQSKEVGDVLKDVFGRQGAAAGIELITALADVETNLEEVRRQTGDWGEAMIRLQEADREMENALASLFGIADGGFSTMTTRLKADVYGAVANVINGFIDWYNKSILVRGAIEHLATSFKNAWEVIKAVLKVFMDSMQSLSQMIEAVFDLDWKGVKAAWSSGVQSLLSDISKAFENIKDNNAQALEQTVNRRIKRIETTEVSGFSENKFKGAGGVYSEEETEDKDQKTKKKTKTEVTVDEGSIKAMQNRVTEITKELTERKLTDEVASSLNEEKTVLEQEIKLLQIRNGLIQAPEDGSLGAMKKRVSEIDKELSDKKNSEERTQALIAEKKELQEQIKSEEKLWKIYDYEEGSVTALKARYGELTKEVESQTVSDERRREIEAESEALRQEIRLAEDRNSKTMMSGEDYKRKKFSESATRVNELKTDVRLNIIGAEEAMSEIERINAELEKLGLRPIEIRVNAKGELETADEALEGFRSRMNETSSAVGTMGSAFGALGGAIEGTGGEMLQFAGQTIQSIASVLPQIATMIAAKEGEAIAGAAASGAGIGFPQNLAAIAAGVAAVAGIFATIPKFEQGGVVPGISFSGDRTLVAANAGELILNKRQQSHLYEAINNGELGGGGPRDVNVTGQFRIKTGDLVAVIDNYRTKTSRQG